MNSSLFEGRFFERRSFGIKSTGPEPGQLVTDEMKQAPTTVATFFSELEPLLIQFDITQATYSLRRAYLEANVVSSRWAADGLDVASATVGDCQAIVSWNFKHIVNFRRIPLYNGVNLVQGYNTIAIHTPQEVLFDEDEEKDL